MFILGVNLPENKLVRIGLTRSDDIGPFILTADDTTTNHKVAELDGIAAPSTLDFHSGPIPQPRLLAIGEDPLQRLLIESDLRREVRANIAHHRAIGSYKGKRHALGFPVNGQRTHTNAKTARNLIRSNVVLILLPQPKTVPRPFASHSDIIDRFDLWILLSTESKKEYTRTRGS
ncbi:hypothetical protein H4Q26_015491 [Puccinia striiformis f. sp. tritici PST-130]|nr:hypothetical protein H4Q26_015491 [Puccinia striiformis f. sp. tritici PST-130]